ncbi:polysaccharide deacetylase family protein [Tetragenococcus koreensis]|uniref:Polysaccharide deacetylase family protein n=2 Tax=Tetragenococcus TaxID=51668 RepID=A0AB37D5L8_TETHA|nr:MULTISPECIES: polysaccharide deacetylase family protein [Tetragenococcus]MCF1586030.1 polysaccharide deacetylase family protein [Tetragenococcus koreensis]MCF1615619.1 polysaccharide deacetylase family protein [Tetragenococcus koreensis]MCF1620668.1 polysaccharide deacetylase family protein [Tetragenococcus koreensis]MCF1625419.1 polysaccharide deacetylase family protein [Tetragenococcus koreensis]MCF1630278.1 polysaccharide deacetylase family protein [Tetragenococcus koreensis]
MGFHALMYHEIREKDSFDATKPSPILVNQPYKDALPVKLFSDLTDFKAQMDFLEQENYYTLSLQEVKNYYQKGKKLPEKSVLLTFDDAYQSVYKYAYPILQQKNFHAVCFVVKSWLFEQIQEFKPSQSVVMAKKELEKMKDVFELANHTTNLHQRYPDGSTEMQKVSEGKLKKDLKDCGQYVDYADIFAYPFGVYRQADVKRLAQLNIQYAFTTVPGENMRQTPVLTLHRDTIWYGCTLSEFKALLRK